METGIDASPQDAQENLGELFTMWAKIEEEMWSGREDMQEEKPRQNPPEGVVTGGTTDNQLHQKG